MALRFPDPGLRYLREAVITMLAVLATLGCVLAIDPEPGPAVLAVVLCMSLSRSQLDRDRRGRIEAVIVLPVVALASVGVGVLLVEFRWLGAVVFVGGMFLSIWLRRFGPAARRAGSLIALPFVALLIVPHVPSTRVTGLFAILVPIVVALIALAWVTAFHALGRALRILPARASIAVESSRISSLRPSASTRMAIQMAIALAASFVVGFVFFPDRWGWIVLTAFIVNSGNRGRGDVAHKSVLRVLGAAAGTVAALLFTVHLGASDGMTVALILLAVFLGIWLRPIGYAWWAVFVTLALAMLQGFTGAQQQLVLLPRLEEIVIGAILGVATAWFVLPVRSTSVLRGRLADALGALSESLESLDPAPFVAAVGNVREVAPAFRASRWFSRRGNHPSDWIEALNDCVAPALAMMASGHASGEARRAAGAARRAVREPDELLPALRTLRAALAAE